MLVFTFADNTFPHHDKGEPMGSDTTFLSICRDSDLSSFSFVRSRRLLIPLNAIAKDAPSSNEMSTTSFKIGTFQTRIRQCPDLPSRGQPRESPREFQLSDN